VTLVDQVPEDKQAVILVPNKEPPTSKRSTLRGSPMLVQEPLAFSVFPAVTLLGVLMLTIGVGDELLLKCK
jgi:hypothetical protein